MREKILIQSHHLVTIDKKIFGKMLVGAMRRVNSKSIIRSQYRKLTSQTSLSQGKKLTMCARIMIEQLKKSPNQ